MASEAAEIIASALEADAGAHERGEFEGIGDLYDQVLQQVLPINDLPEQVFGMAFSFWDCWLDAKNHGWLHHEPITREDWPNMARMIATCVRDASVPVDPTIRSLFVPMPKASSTTLFTRIMGWFHQKG